MFFKIFFVFFLCFCFWIFFAEKSRFLKTKVINVNWKKKVVIQKLNFPYEKRYQFFFKLTFFGRFQKWSHGSIPAWRTFVFTLIALRNCKERKQVRNKMKIMHIFCSNRHVFIFEILVISFSCVFCS